MSGARKRKREPRRAPLATVPALLLAVAMIGAGVVGVHDLLTARGWTQGTPWVPDVLGDVDGLRPTWWTTTLGVVLALVGLLLVAVGFRRGRVTHRRSPIGDLANPQAATRDVWITPRALARFAQGAAERTTGVVSATARVRRRRLVVSARTLTDDTVSGRLRDNLARSVGGFTRLRTVVRARGAKDAV